MNNNKLYIHSHTLSLISQYIQDINCNIIPHLNNQQPQLTSFDHNFLKILEQFNQKTLISILLGCQTIKSSLKLLFNLDKNHYQEIQQQMNYIIKTWSNLQQKLKRICWKDIELQCKMHKARINQLNNIIMTQQQISQKFHRKMNKSQLQKMQIPINSQYNHYNQSTNYQEQTYSDLPNLQFIQQIEQNLYKKQNNQQQKQTNKCIQSLKQQIQQKQLLINELIIIYQQHMLICQGIINQLENDNLSLVKQIKQCKFQNTLNSISQQIIEIKIQKYKDHQNIQYLRRKVNQLFEMNRQMYLQSKSHKNLKTQTSRNKYYQQKNSQRRHRFQQHRRKNTQYTHKKSS